MPIQAPAWTEFLTCPVCCNEFDGSNRSPISLACSHTVCKACLQNLHKKQCPFDQTILKSDVRHLPVNSALLELVGGEVGGETSGSVVPVGDRASWTQATTAVRRLAAYLRPGATALSRPMQRKLVALVNCQLAEEEGRGRAMRAARSLGDRTVTELILHHQNPQHLSANLWAAVRARGCQFLGPAMQEEVLKLVLLALEDGSALSRKVLVMFVVQRLEPHFPQASKTSIGHVVQLLYRASSFKVSKREGDSSLMQLKEEFRSYEALRREHDAQIVQIATEAGLRIAPDQWSALLYGDSAHKSHMQSIVDKLQSPGAFAHSIEELVIALQRTNDPGRLSQLRPHLDLLAHIDPNPESGQYSMTEVARGLEACRTVVACLVEFMRTHGASTKGGSNMQNNASAASGPPSDQAALPQALGFKYKVSLCRDLMHKGNCPRGPSCTFAHSNDELDKFRAKNRKPQNRNIISNKEDDNAVDNIFFSEGNGDYSGYPISSSYPSNHHLQQSITSSLSPTAFPSFHQGESPPYKCVSSGGGNVCYHNDQVVNISYSQENTPQITNLPESSQPRQIQPRGKQSLWRSLSLPNKKMLAIGSGSISGSNWAVLQHRRQELLNQLEKVVARCNNNTIIPAEKVEYSGGGRSSGGGGGTVSNTANYSVWNMMNSNIVDQTVSQPVEHSSQNYLHNVYCRGESVVSEEEFIPFDPPVVSKFGPISRDSSGGTGLKTDEVRSSPVGSLHQVGNLGALPSPTYLPPTHWLYSPQPAAATPQPIHQPPGYMGRGQVMVDPNREGFMSVSPSSTALDPVVNKQIHHPPSIVTPKEFLAESQKMKQQLKTLEKRINDLKVASNGVALVQGQKLTQELHLIEQGIIEKEKLLGISHSDSISSLSSPHNSSGGYRSDEGGAQEDSYEAGIANDIRELELRWQFELEEQEKRWSSEEECNKK